MKIFEVSGVGKLHGLTVMSLDSFVQGDEPEIEESDISGIMHAARNYNNSFIVTAETGEGQTKRYRVKAQSERVAREKFAKHHNQAKIVSVEQEGVEEGWSNKMVARRTGTAPTPYSVYISGKEWKSFADDDHAENVANKLRAKFKADGREPSVITIAPTGYDKGINEADAGYKEEMAQVYNKLAPGIERYRDSFKAGELYDALEAVAEKHGALGEFNRMMRGARNSAHMDYDTNPGGFENWFWYLPFDSGDFNRQTDDWSDDFQSRMKQGVAEAPGDFGLGATFRPVPDEEMQAFLDRSKTKNKTKRDKFDYPYVHGSNIQVKDESGKEYDLEALKKEIMTRPKSILGQNAKMQHSETGEEAIFDIGLPALKGLAVNEKTGQFVVVDTCPGAGACQTYCYAMKGSYVMFKAVSMGLARMLNFLLNDPEGFASKLNAEIAAAKAKYAKKGAKIVVRWHDAGDFFSPEYMDMAYSVANANPDVGFYAYTKMGDVANAARPKNFNMNFSQGAKRGQEKKVDIVRTKHSKVVPKDMFFDLIARKGNELIKDAKGRMQFASEENLEEFKTKLAQKYAIDKDSILTYDQMMKIPVGDTPKWNVIVMPGDGDNSANRNDVIGSYLLFH